MDINRKALKSGMWYTICNFLVKGLGFISTPIFTRLLTKSDFGLFNNYTSWMSLITVFVTINLEASLISAKHDFEDDFDEYVSSIMKLTLVMGILWIVIVNLFQKPLIAFTNVDGIYLNAMIFYIVFNAAINLYQAKERYQYGYKKTVLISFAFAITSTMLSIVLVCLLNNKLFGRILGMVIPSVVIGIVTIISMLSKKRKKNGKYWRYAVLVCLPYIPHILAGSVLGSMDRIMIQRYWGAESTALYSLAYNCGTIVTMLTVSLNAAFSPWLSDKISEKNYDDIKKVSKVYVVLFCYLVVGIMIVSPEVLYILGGAEYMESKYVITPVAMGCACQFIYTLYVNIEQIKKKTVGMACATVVAACVNYALNLIFIPRVGYLAAAYTTLVGYICLLIIHVFVVRGLNMQNVYDSTFMLGVVVLGIVCMLLVTYTYKNNWMRLFLVILYVICSIMILAKNRNFIFNYIRRKKNV